MLMRAIFISYRRDDTEGQSGRLYDDLVRRFGDGAVFMDVAGIEAGRDFRKVIDENVASCGVLLSVIGPTWLDAKDETGVRRLDNPMDFVRLETAAALKRDILVVPVLVRGARMPKSEQLPDDLKELAYRNGLELTHARWDSDVEVLIKALQRHVTDEPAKPDKPLAPEHPKTGREQPYKKSRRATIAIIAGAIVVAAVVGVFSARSTWSKKNASGQSQLTSPPEAVATLCVSGYVWREARSTDHVCVTPESRTLVKQENSKAPQRWMTGAYGPHTCIHGYVWREAFKGDDVCVTPERRDQVREENRVANSLRASQY